MWWREGGRGSKHEGGRRKEGGRERRREGGIEGSQISYYHVKKKKEVAGCIEEEVEVEVEVEI